jgi:hypothetical protein
VTNLSDLFEQFLKEKQYIDGVTAKTLRTCREACRGGSVNLLTRYGGCGIARKGRPAGEGIPSRPSLAYNLSNSQWYIQWLRTLRNRGTERVPKRSKAGQRINADRLFLCGYRRRESF